MTNRKRVGITIPIGLYKELKEEADFSGQTLNGLIRQILWDWIEEKKKEAG